MPDEFTEPDEPAAEVDISDGADIEVPTETDDSETYTIKVDGEDQAVTLEELQAGYSRQADYTRKTQELAAERQRLQQAETIANALESDPEGTLKALSSAFGIASDNPQVDSESFDDSWDTEDPTAQRIAKIEAQLETQAAAARQQALDKEVSALKGRYGEFDEQALFAHALQNRIPNLDAAYAHMKFGEVSAVAEKLQADKDVTEAKREAAVVAGGKSTQSGAVSSKSSGKAPSTIREAFSLAKATHGN